MLKELMVMAEMLKARAFLREMVGTVQMVQIKDEDGDNSIDYINVEGQQGQVHLEPYNDETKSGDIRFAYTFECVCRNIIFYRDKNEVHYDEPDFWWMYICDGAILTCPNPV